MIFIDASFFVSLFINTDRNFSKAVRYYSTDTQEKITSEDIIKETLTVVSQRMDKSTSIDAFNKIQSDCSILPVTTERYHAGLTLFLNPKLQKDVSFIDCIAAAICKELKIRKIFSFDHHFTTLGLHPLP